ncbi:hypothetical protein [Bacillus bombysepticus]|uniref:hypothetical protein n=1 Tax=Bacillus bombysepticus TaxID=658666 RepID=UPI003017BB4B
MNSKVEKLQHILNLIKDKNSLVNIQDILDELNKALSTNDHSINHTLDGETDKEENTIKNMQKESLTPFNTIFNEAERILVQDWESRNPKKLKDIRDRMNNQNWCEQKKK